MDSAAAPEATMREISRLRNAVARLQAELDACNSIIESQNTEIMELRDVIDGYVLREDTQCLRTHGEDRRSRHVVCSG